MGLKKDFKNKIYKAVIRLRLSHRHRLYGVGDRSCGV